MAAINQLNIKRLYAYSAIVNVGYMVTAMSYGTLSGFSVLINYLLVYVLSTISLFIILLLFRTAFGGKKIKHIADYKHLATYSTPLAILIALLFFSLAGVPPLAGFFIKFFLFKGVFMLDFMQNLAVFVILITSVVSAFYYIRVVRFIFFDVKRAPLLFMPLDKTQVLVFTLLSLFLLLFVVFQQLLLLSVSVTLMSFFI